VKRSLEPKVFVPHERKPGQAPRKVEVERKKVSSALLLTSRWSCGAEVVSASFGYMHVSIYCAIYV
jgi:hypothetical protein